MKVLHTLRTGALPLGVAFWGYAVLGSILTHVAWFLCMGDPRAPSGIALLVGAPLCAFYQVMMTLGVWRSAGRYRGDPRLAWSARGVVAVYAACGLWSYGLMAWMGLLFLGVMTHPPFFH